MTIGRHHITNRTKSLIMIILATTNLVLGVCCWFLYAKNNDFFNKIKDMAQTVIQTEAKMNTVTKQGQDLKALNETLKKEQDTLKNRNADLESQVKLSILNYDKKNKESQDSETYVEQLKVYIKLYRDTLNKSMELNQKLAQTKNSKLELQKIRQELVSKEKSMQASSAPKLKTKAECVKYYQSWLQDTCKKLTKQEKFQIQVVNENEKSVYICLNEKQERVPKFSLDEKFIEKSCENFK